MSDFIIALLIVVGMIITTPIIWELLDQRRKKIEGGLK